MKIRKISQNEVTVYISESELDGYDIKPGEKIPESAALHKFLFELMDTVYIETGFNPYGGQVVVEATPLQNGMSFTISKVGRKTPITREEFKKIKKVSVKRKDAQPESLSDLTHEDIMSIVEGIAKRKLKQRRELNKTNTGVFVFESYKDMENAFCMIQNEDLEKCSLYRNKNMYAIVSDFVVNSKNYNILSEFASKVITAEIAATDIKEGWVKIVDGHELVHMALAIQNMM